MRKVLIDILLIMLCTFAVCGLVIHKSVDNNSTCSVNGVHQQKAVVSRTDTNKKCLAEVAACKKDSQSVFSKLFTFEIPKLPLEDFFLAAQKALVEKLF